MLVRVRWRTPETIGSAWPQLALGLSSLFAPLALLAFTLAFWAFAAEVQWANAFFFSQTLFAHWEVWLALAALLLLLGHGLAKIGSKETSISSQRNPDYHNSNTTEQIPN